MQSAYACVKHAAYARRGASCARMRATSVTLAPLRAATHVLARKGRRKVKTLGWLLFLIGLVALLAGLGMDTTVATGDGRRVHNIGLMRDQQNALMLGGLLLVVSLVLIVAGRRKGQEVAAPTAVASPSDEKTCPYCAERIKAAAVVCRFCNRDLQSAPPPAPRKTLGSFHATAEQLEDLGIYYDGNVYHVGDVQYREFKDAERAAALRR